MNANRHFEDEDLALYAMRLLAEPDTSAVARDLAENSETRTRLAAVQAQLAAFAEASVPLVAPPAGSIDRLFERIAREPVRPRPQAQNATDTGHLDREPASVTPIRGPVSLFGASASEPERPRRSALLTWAGWAAAAALALTAGKFYHDRSALDQTLSARSGEVVHLATDKSEVDRQRDALQQQLADQTRRVDQLTAGLEASKGEASNLRSTVAATGAKAAQETARAEQESAHVQEQQTRAAAAEQARSSSDQARLSAERERDALRGTVASQSAQVAQLTSDAARAREVLQALTDRTALRVTLTQPKSAVAPTGRATYVASRGTLVFQANNLAQLEANKVYELWILPADGSSPVPAGTFSPDTRGNASVVSAKLPGAVAAKGFAITVENQGGATTPTLPILLVGTAGA